MIEWLQNHWADIGVIGLAFIKLAEAIVAVTETKKDDEIVAKIKGVVLHFFGLTSHKPEDK